MLSVIVPIGKMDGNIDKLSYWIEKIDPNLSEVILVHDIQDETTAPVLSKLKAKVPGLNIVLIEGRWGNPGNARNAGLSNATQEWITFWDADDLPAFENVTALLQNQNVETEVVIGQFEVVDILSNEKLEKQSSTTCLNDLVLDPGLWRMIFRREMISSLKFPNISMAEDQLFLISANLTARNIVYTSTLFYTYYKGQINQLTKNSIKVRDLYISLEILSELISNGESPNLKFARLLYLRQFSTLLKRCRPINLSEIVTKFRKEYLGEFPFKPWSKFLDLFVFFRILLIAKIK